jgi:multiple sugar transport system permease protein
VSCGAYNRKTPTHMSNLFTKIIPRPTYRAQLRIFLAPYLLGIFVLVIIPALLTFGMAFTKYNAVSAPKWVGFENFSRLWTSVYARSALRNTLIFVLSAVPIRLVGALGLALLLQRKGLVFGIFRSIVYLPTVIPEVAYALIWMWIFNPLYGPLNISLNHLGLDAPSWWTEAGTARLAIVVMLVFTLGEGFIVMLAALQNISRSYYEAATVDGASTWQCFWKITFPLILPLLLLLTFRDMILSLQSTFTPSFVITYGGPYYATTFAPLLVYELAFDFYNLGLASAALIMTYILLGILVIGILNFIEELKLDDYVA